MEDLADVALHDFLTGTISADVANYITGNTLSLYRLYSIKLPVAVGHRIQHNLQTCSTLLHAYILLFKLTPYKSLQDLYDDEENLNLPDSANPEYYEKPLRTYNIGREKETLNTILNKVSITTQIKKENTHTISPTTTKVHIPVVTPDLKENKKDPLEELSTKLLRNAKHAGIKKFYMQTDPSTNRKRFDQFMIDIINICDLTPETRTIFMGYPSVTPTTSDPIVDTALFMLLLSKTEGYSKNLIKNLTSQGCKAITALKDTVLRLHLRTNIEYKRNFYTLNNTEVKLPLLISDE